MARGGFGRGFGGRAFMYGGFGPGYYGAYGPYGSYGPYGGWYGGFYGPYRTPNAGQVKFDTKAKQSEVFIDGSFAGTVKQLKTMTLSTGSYDIEVRTPGRTPFQQQVYVVAGKTVTLHLDVPAVPIGS